MPEELQEHINKDVKDDIVRHEEILASHAKHLAVANEEVGKIQVDIVWIKESLTKLDTRIWLILSAIILGILVQIALKLL